MKAEAWIAIYAAIVATSALLLNFRTWLDSRPRLRLSLMADGMVLGGGPRFDEKDLLILNVVNRGREPTVIENMVLFEMKNWWRRWRMRPTKSYVIPEPQLKGYPANVPGEIEPAKKWTGAIRKGPKMLVPVHDGKHYVGVYASHRDRPYLIRIPEPQSKLPENTEIFA